GVAGEGMTKAINWAVMIANNDGYGYDSSAARTTGWVKWQSDPNCTNQCGSFDCSSLISAALTVAGYFDTNPNFWTGNEAQYLEGAGFKKVATSATTSQDLLPGDILLANDHTSLYIGSKQMVAAHINENGDTSGGQVGDQTKGEISVSTYQDHNPPYIAVYRATK
ncbi:MAG TPA: peptidoglycan amidohydrolase family protein, partial [Candidatus Saccharimonadales bacterium]|nr:peptidoglycan amidohydrolase family protein [Candidatus Saccharimonadales bacterium]